MAGMNNNEADRSEPKSTSKLARRKPRHPVRRQSLSPRAESPPEPDPNLPHWLPVGDDWGSLPKSIRQAVPQILTPAYRRFVLEAPGELERSFGLTLVHLMWLELCDQAKLVAATDPNSLDAVLGNAEQLTERHLHLVSAKCQTAELLVKLRLLGETLDTGQLRRGPTPQTSLLSDASEPLAASQPECSRHTPCADRTI
jgi:hypothetical protein